MIYKRLGEEKGYLPEQQPKEDPAIPLDADVQITEYPPLVVSEKLATPNKVEKPAEVIIKMPDGGQVLLHGVAISGESGRETVIPAALSDSASYMAPSATAGAYNTSSGIACYATDSWMPFFTLGSACPWHDRMKR